MQSRLTTGLCYCCCSKLLRLGSGRRVGECCEQTWALLRPVTKLTRYMTKQGYLEGLDDALLLISDDKLQYSVAALVTQHAACAKKIGEQPWTCSNQSVGWCS